VNEPVAGNYVEVGPDRLVTLCHRVCLVRGMGQLWHVHGSHATYVISRMDACGKLHWSFVVDIEAFAKHFKIRLQHDHTAIMSLGDE
jgi:hypothetical protein